jgi:hypothetical protein
VHFSAFDNIPASAWLKDLIGHLTLYDSGLTKFCFDDDHDFIAAVKKWIDFLADV